MMILVYGVGNARNRRPHPSRNATRVFSRAHVLEVAAKIKIVFRLENVIAARKNLRHSRNATTGMPPVLAKSNTIVLNRNVMTAPGRAIFAVRAIATNRISVRKIVNIALSKAANVCPPEQ